MPSTDVTIVVVLYGTSPATSPALTSLAASIAAFPGRFVIDVHDNSANPGRNRSVPGLALASDTFHAHNPGLAVPYNLALDAAEQRGCSWLMLLDQDTQVTSGYLHEVIELVDSPEGVGADVGAAVPCLVAGGAIMSPHRPQRIWTRPLSDPGLYPPSTNYSFLNSGCVIRVAAARAVGGFPEDYSLDYVDHVMAARLRSAGYSLLVLASHLKHDMSILDMNALSPVRLRSMTTAEEQFFAERGSRSGIFWLFVRRTARAAFILTGLRTSPDRYAELKAVRRAARLLLTPPRRGNRSPRSS